MSDRDWKDAKPKWVVDAAKAEMAEKNLTLSLRWPNEAEKDGLFGFKEYDNKWGDIQFGEFWVSSGYKTIKVFLREKIESDSGWKQFRTSYDGVKWTETVERGHYFKNEKDARLKTLWYHCRKASQELLVYWSQYEASK